MGVSASPAAWRYTRPFWVISPAVDLLFLLVPLTYVALGVTFTLPALLTYGLLPIAALNVFTEIIFGGTSHIGVTFLLLKNRALRQALPGGLLRVLGPALLLCAAGPVAMVLLAHHLQAQALPIAIAFVGFFAVHHNLAQCRGFFVIYEGRLVRDGAPAGDPDTRRLVELYLVLTLGSVWLSWFCTPGGIAAPWLMVETWAIGGPALALFGLGVAIMVHLLRRPVRSVPQLLYMVRLLLYPVALVVSPFILFAGLSAAHGVEYFALSATLLRRRAGEGRPGRRPVVQVVLLILAACLPGLVFVLSQPRFRVQALADLVGYSALGAPVVLERIFLPLTGLWVGFSLAHYYLDRHLFRFRYPALRAAVLPYLDAGGTDDSRRVS